MKKLLLILALLFVCTNVQAQYPKHCPSDGQFVTWANADTQFVCSVAVLPISYTKVTHQWLDSYNSATGLFTSSQPNFTDLSGTISTSTQMPNSGVTAGSYTNANLTINAQGLVTAAANGSGGSTPYGTTNGGFSYADLVPASPNAMDDEFNGSSLDAKWTWVNQGVNTTTVGNGILTMTGVKSGSSDGVRYIYQTAPSTPWEVTMKVTFFGLAWANFNWMGLVLDQASNHPEVYCMWWNAGVHYSVMHFNNLGTGNSAFADSTNAGLVTTGIVYLRIKDDGTNLIYSYSRDGLSFTQWTTESRTNWFTSGPTRVGIVIVRQNSTSINDNNLDVDWFRRTL